MDCYFVIFDIFNFFFILSLVINFEITKWVIYVCLIEKIINALINFAKDFNFKTLSLLIRFCVFIDKQFTAFFMWLFRIHPKCFLSWLHTVVFGLFKDISPIGSFVQSFCLYVNRLVSGLFDFFKVSNSIHQSYFFEIKRFFVKFWLTPSTVICKFKAIVFNVISIFIQLLKWVIFSGIITTFYICVTLSYSRLVQPLTTCSWFVVLVIGYLTLSVFTTILNRYRFGKFTSGVQRVWKRSFIFFWFLELGVYAVYFLYYLTHLSNSWNLNDAETNNNFLMQLDGFFYSTVVLVFCLFFCYLLIYAVNFGKTGHTVFLLFCTTALLIVVLYREAYQIHYLMNCFLSPSFDSISSQNSWLHTVAKTRKLSPKVEYFLLCPLLRFWHFFCIYINWCFFVSRALIVGRVNYGLLCFNVQNFLMLLFMSLISIFQLLAFYCAWGLSEPFSFFLIVRNLTIIDFCCSILSTIFTTINHYFFILFGWVESVYFVFFDVQSEFENYTATSSSFSTLEIAGRDYKILI